MRISIFGAGYVGVVTGTCLAREGHTVVCVDISESKVSSLKKGESPVVEPGLTKVIPDVVREGRLSATVDASAAVVVCRVSQPRNRIIPCISPDV